MSRGSWVSSSVLVSPSISSRMIGGQADAACGVAALRPDRTWAGGGDAIDREYVWHDFARQWQTPDVGERVMDEVMTSEKGVPILVQSGVPREIAQEVVARIDRRMKQAMLRLYRSATNIGAEWHADVDVITSPGLVIWGAEDPFVP